VDTVTAWDTRCTQAVAQAVDWGDADAVYRLLRERLHQHATATPQLRLKTRSWVWSVSLEQLGAVVVVMSMLGHLRGGDYLVYREGRDGCLLNVDKMELITESTPDSRQGCYVNVDGGVKAGTAVRSGKAAGLKAGLKSRCLREHPRHAAERVTDSAFYTAYSACHDRQGTAGKWSSLEHRLGISFERNDVDLVKATFALSAEQVSARAFSIQREQLSHCDVPNPWHN